MTIETLFWTLGKLIIILLLTLAFECLRWLDRKCR